MSIDDNSSCVALKDGGSYSNFNGAITVNGTPYTAVDPCPGSGAAGVVASTSVTIGAAAAFIAMIFA